MTSETPQESFRPALVKLTDDIEESQQDLLAGLNSRRDALHWIQSLLVRTLGCLPDQVVENLGEQFRPHAKGDEQPVLAAMLAGGARTIDIDQERAQALRERTIATYIRPVHHKALRHLRADATEYIDEGHDDTDHSPAKQRYIAMRPALDEIHESQARALNAFLDGFDDEQDILSWAAVLELATHGELDKDFGSRCIKERSLRELLLDHSTTGERAREVLAAKLLLPAFNAGVRDLSGRAGERPDADRDGPNKTVA